MRLLCAALVFLSVSALDAMAAAARLCPVAPPGWTVELRKGPDFHVCYFRHPNKKGQFGMYDGNHPSFRPPASSEGLSGNVDGIAVTWFKAPTVVGKSDFRHDTVLTGKCGPFAHIWVQTNSASEIEEILEAASAIRLRHRHPEPHEQHDLSEMTLVATNPDGDPKGRWAEFLDPVGRYHRVRLGGGIGTNHGILKRVSKSSATVNEIFQAPDCDWVERLCVVTRTGTSCELQ